MALKSDEIAAVDEISLETVILQDMTELTRTTVLALTHDRIDAVDGTPYTVKSEGLPVSCAPEFRFADIEKDAVALNEA